MIRSTCPLCGRTYSVEDRFAGKTGRCKVCGGEVRVPGQPVEEPGELFFDPDEGPPEEPAGPEPATGQDQAADRSEEAVEAVAGAESSSAEPAAEAVEPEGPPAPEPSPEPEGEDAQAGSEEHHTSIHFEPAHGPTTVEGPWLTRRPGEKARPEPEPKPPAAEEVLGTSRLVTAVDAGPRQAARPVLLTLACIAVGLLGLAFAGVVVGRAGASVQAVAVAAIAVALGVLGAARLWSGHADGLIPGVLLCVCILVAMGLAVASAGGKDSLADAFTPPVIAFLSASVAVLALILVAGLLPSARRYYARSA